MDTLPYRREFTVYAEYHQFYVLDAGTAPEATGNDDFWTREAFTRMLAVNPGILGIGAMGSGGVPVTLQVSAEAPGDDLAGWDHVVEAALQLPSGKLIVCGCTQPREEGLQVALAPGNYRARVCYGKLDTVVDELGEDRYAVFLWPGDSTDLRVLKEWRGAARLGMSP